MNYGRVTNGRMFGMNFQRDTMGGGNYLICSGGGGNREDRLNADLNCGYWAAQYGRNGIFYDKKRQILSGMYCKLVNIFRTNRM